MHVIDSASLLRSEADAGLFIRPVCEEAASSRQKANQIADPSLLQRQFILRQGKTAFKLCTHEMHHPPQK